MLLSIASVIVRGAVLALRKGNLATGKNRLGLEKTDGVDEELGLVVHHLFERAQSIEVLQIYSRLF